MQGMTGANDKIRLVMTIVPKGVYLANSCNYVFAPKDFEIEALLGILNSKLINWYFRCFSTNSNVNGYEIDNLPIPQIDRKIQMNLKNLVSKLSQCTNDTSKVESMINHIVYDLYGLSEDEIKIIEQS